MKPSAYPGTQAVLRAMALLKAFSQERAELGLGDLAGRVGLNKTTAFRLLTALQSEGMIARSGDGSYRLGPELLALGRRVQGAGDLRLASRGELQALALATRETATLEILVAGEVVIVDEAMGGHVVGSVPSFGTRWPAHATSTGKAILAELSEDERWAALAGSLARLTPRTITTRPALERELARVRDRGYAVSTEELEPGFVAVGAALRSATGAVVAAVSVGGPKSRLGAERVGELARQVPEAAARISERLGFRSPEPGRVVTLKQAKV
jgi:DNA-binding IclR family transcriptional regulator